MRLRRLEARLRDLLEVRLVRAMPGRRPADLLIQQLTSSIEEHALTSPDGSRLAPNVYTLAVQDVSRPRWHKPALIDTLIEVIRAAVTNSALRLASPPVVTFSEDPSLGPDEVRIIASHTAEAAGQTQDMQADTDSKSVDGDVPAIPENAFLIVNGVKEFPLKVPVINIGRRLDNDLVIEDPRVSRHHAQLRAIKNRFVLFDLDSSGGTYINGQRTSQTVLYPGDVVSLAGVSLIFGQDVPLPQRDPDQTGPRSAASADRATAIIKSTRSAFRKP